MIATEKPKKKHPGGRRKKLPFIDIELVQNLYKEGLTDKQVAKVIKISEKTLYTYKLTNKQFLQAQKKGKKYSNDLMVDKLWQLGMGWKNTKPDRESIMNWLYNRDPKNWRRRNEVSLGGQYNNPDAAPIQTESKIEAKIDTRLSIKDLPVNILKDIRNHIQK